MNITKKKERMELFYKFLESCSLLFSCGTKFKSIFLRDGSPIFDLYDIPDGERFIYLSDSHIMRGIKIIYNKEKMKTLNKYTIEDNRDNQEFLLKSKNKYKENKGNLGFFRKLRMKNKKVQNIRKEFKDLYRKRTKTKQNDILNKSFSYYLDREEDYLKDDEEWAYYSDNEKNKNKCHDYLKEKVCEDLEKYEIIIYFNQSILEQKKNKIMSENTRKKRKFKVAKSEVEELNLIDDYNSQIKKKDKELQEYIKSKAERHKNNDFSLVTEKKSKKKNDDDSDPLMKQTKLFMRKFLENMQIFKIEEKAEVNENLFKQDPKLKYVSQNKQKFENIYFHLDKHVDKYYPNLFYFNIPRLLKLYTTFDRKELYEVFIQYKVLMKLCIGINKTAALVKNGVDFTTFWKGVPQMSGEDADLARKIFNVINYRKNSYLSLEEFLRGMSIIRSPNIAHKIDMFFKIIDTDGNGLLSFDEVYEISLMSLQRTVKTENENSTEVIAELAEYFATLIFRLVDVDIDDEIPLPKVKERILDGGGEADYLEMFCCADGFKKVDVIKFQ